MTKKELIDLIKYAPEDSIINFEYGGLNKTRENVDSVVIISTNYKKVDFESETTLIVLK